MHKPPRGIITTTKKLSKAEREEIKRKFYDLYKGPGGPSCLILLDGGEWEEYKSKSTLKAGKYKFPFLKRNNI